MSTSQKYFTMHFMNQRKPTILLKWLIPSVLNVFKALVKGNFYFATHS